MKFVKIENQMSVWCSLSRLARVTVIFLAVMIGCKDNATNPRFEPEITNATDSFQFQVTNIRKISQTLRYTWQNTGTVANVNQSCSVSEGTAGLTIHDGAGLQVYSRNLSDNGTFVTSAGTAGNWTIQVVLSNCSGTLNFRVQKGG